MLAGLLCGSVYLTFAVAVTTAAASLARSTLATIGLTLGALLALPLLGMIGPIHTWLPSTLVTAPITLLGNSTLSDYLPALATATTATALLLTAATLQLKHRDV
jgi:ABC-2 type transport system permease protein